MKPFFTLFAFLLVLLPAVRSQDIELDKHNIDSIYRRADSIAFSVPFTEDVIAATSQLTKNCYSNIEKFRVLYKWITEHIEYDIAMYNKGLNKEYGVTISCKDKNDCDLKFHDYYFQYCKSILRKKAGICDGYARLYKVMCDFAKIPCEVVEGHAKSKDSEIGRNGSVEHAWNAVLLNKTWFFLDATWGAGGATENEETGKLKAFIKNFDDWYFLKDYKSFLFNHYPKDEKWLFELKTHTKTDFYLQPFYYTTAVTSYFQQEYYKEKGVINIHSYDTLLCFTYKLSAKERKTLKQQGHVNFTIGYKTKLYNPEIVYPDVLYFDDRVHFCVPLKAETPSSLVIYIDDFRVIKYKLQFLL
jgi:Transglutaminase-like superfamily